MKVQQLRSNYGRDVRFNLFLCGYFDSGYLGYEAAENIDRWCGYVLDRQFSDVGGWELQNMLTVARLIIEAALEVTKIYSVSGMLPPDIPLVLQRPFRSPHHTTSHAGLVGVTEGIGQAPPLRCRPGGETGHAGVADAALGHVDHPPQRDLVGRVDDHPEVGQGVLHLASLVEPGASDHLVRDRAADHGRSGRPATRCRGL